jgi:hypothetical protein
MEILVDIEQGRDASLLIGNWEDLEYLVRILNEAFEDVEYRLEKVPGGETVYLFVEDPIFEDEYECGIVEKIGAKAKSKNGKVKARAYALSEKVHIMVMSAYERYVDEYGELA